MVYGGTHPPPSTGPWGFEEPFDTTRFQSTGSGVTASGTYTLTLQGAGARINAVLAAKGPVAKAQALFKSGPVYSFLNAHGVNFMANMLTPGSQFVNTYRENTDITKYL